MEDVIDAILGLLFPILIMLLIGVIAFSISFIKSLVIGKRGDPDIDPFIDAGNYIGSKSHNLVKEAAKGTFHNINKIMEERKRHRIIDEEYKKAVIELHGMWRRSDPP